MSSTNWGADSRALLNFYISLIRSELDYGCISYGSSCQPYIKLLDTVYHQGLPLSLGSSRTSQLRVSMLKQTSLLLKLDVSNLVCNMKPNWRLVLKILHKTVFSILYMKMFTMINQIQFYLLKILWYIWMA